MRALSFLIFLSFIFPLTFSLPNTNPAYPPCDLGTSSCTSQQEEWNTASSFTILDQSIIYMYVKDEWTEQVWNTTFWPRVDEFSMIEVVYSFESFGYNPNISMWLDFHGTNTSAVHYASNDNVVAYWTAVIQLDNGAFNNIVWNDGCSDCNCIDNNCGVSINEYCIGSYDCEMKVYLAWSGTDSQSYPCTSVNSIPANFQKYSLTPYYEVGVGLVDNILYKVQGGIDTGNPNTPQYT